GLVHRPMAGAGDVGLHALVAAAVRIGFEGASLQIGNLARRIEELFRARRWPALELVIQTFITEIAVRVCDPLLQPTVRLNDEFGHVSLSAFRLSITRCERAPALHGRIRKSTDARAGSVWTPCRIRRKVEHPTFACVVCSTRHYRSADT